MRLKVSVIPRPRAWGTPVPVYGSAGASGLDLCADLAAPVELRPFQQIDLPTGIRVEIPPGYEGQVRPRSGLARKHGFSLVNTPGTIDADYRGEIVVLGILLGQEPLVLTPGMRIAQLVIAPVVRVQVELADDLTFTGRGSGGFG